MDAKEALDNVWAMLRELDSEICNDAHLCKHDYLLGYGTALLDLKGKLEKFEETLEF
jgi:hypothetical protein